MSIEHFAHSLTGLPVYLVIGGHDHRVLSASCVRLAVQLMELDDLSCPAGSCNVELHVVEAGGHGIVATAYHSNGEYSRYADAVSWLLQLNDRPRM